MTRTPFLVGAALGAGVVVGAFADACFDLTGRAALAVAPIERSWFKARYKRTGLQRGETYWGAEPPVASPIPVCQRCDEDADLCPCRLGPCTGQLPDLADEP